MELHQASRQWTTRPADERFTSITELHQHCEHARANSAARVVASRSISCAPVENDPQALVVLGPNGAPVTPTHWAFTQLASRAGAPAGYLRELPGAMAADCINYGLQHRDIDDIGILLHKNGRAPELRAVTGPGYGRVWNSVITGALQDHFEDGQTFKVPGIRGTALDAVTKENTTLFASDRDMFVFLADEEHRIEIPNRRNGEAGALARGFFMWNSEVGAQTFGVATFLFDYVCANRIVWGAGEYHEIRVRHTASAPERFVQEVKPALLSYANSSARSIEQGIAAARNARLEPDRVGEFLVKRFTKGQAKAIEAAHMQDEQRPIESLWDCAVGVTAYARELPYQDERVKLEREAGRILDMAA